jgi:hypothetical protein
LAFNQPLSFDTSNVTDMTGMFQVRSARALTLTPWVGPSPSMPLAPPPPPGSHLAPHRMPLPSTRQEAQAFNQLLSFDTSKVTHMGTMFFVRSARALAPTSLESGLPPCMRRRRPTPSRLPARTSPRIACPSLSTRQRTDVFNQPLSFDTSEVTLMGWMFSVRSARALTPNSLESGHSPVHAACAAAAPHPPASRRAPRPVSHVPLPTTRQDARAFNQPLSFDTSKVTDMTGMFYVRSARALTLTP